MIAPKPLYAAAWLLLCCSAFADLRWEKPIQSFACTPDEKRAEAHFKFQNTGSSTVTIKSVRTSCGCTSAKLEKKVYLPGESGEIVAIYSFHGQKGALRKLVTVVSDDHPETPSILDIRVQVSEPFQIKPTLVYWRRGDSPEAKSVRLLASGNPVHIKSVTSSDPNISVLSREVKPGEEYALEIKPQSTAAKDSAEIIVTTDFPPDSPRRYTIHAKIK